MNICIYGYGLEGKSTEKFLTQHFPEVKIHIYDENISGHGTFEPEKYDLIFVSPGIDRTKKVAEKYWPKCTSQISYFFSLLTEEKRKKVIGITGSKGKSTTTKFVAEFLENAGYNTRVAGNFGVPFLDVLDDFMRGKIDYIVAEISSYQAEFLQDSPHIAMFLSFFLEHLDRHGSEQDYLAAKTNCWKHQRDGDFLIFSEVLTPLSDLVKVSPAENRLLIAPPLAAEYFDLHSIFRAPHFLQNFGVVEALASILKIPDMKKVLKKTAESFVGLPHRTEFLGEKGGMEFYNDSIATAPTAAAGGVNFFGDRLGYLLLGGENGGDRFDDLLVVITKKTPHLEVFITQSEILEPFEVAAKKHGFSEYKVVPDFQAAMARVQAQPKTGKVCLLSPAGKSFDQYENYAKRGDHFRKMVAAI